MEDEIKIANCGCGGEVKIISRMNADYCQMVYYVKCEECGTETDDFFTEAEAIQVWDKAMGAKDINVPNKFATDTNVGNKTAKFKQDGKFLRCGKCNHIVDSGYKYCPNCGCRLEFK